MHTSRDRCLNVRSYNLLTEHCSTMVSDLQCLCVPRQNIRGSWFKPCLFIFLYSSFLIKLRELGNYKTLLSLRSGMCLWNEKSSSWKGIRTPASPQTHNENSVTTLNNNRDSNNKIWNCEQATGERLWEKTLFIPFDFILPKL